jgi:hypothetical protein
MEFFAHDASDPDNRAMWGMRDNENHDVWLNVKAMDVLSPRPTTGSGNDIRWVNLWLHSTLELQHAIHYVRKTIILNRAGHPSSFRFSLRPAPGCTIEVAQDSFILRDQQGDIRMRSRVPYGYDAGGEIDGQQIRMTLVQSGTWGPTNEWPILTLTPNADDLAAAVYPVVLDPTTDVSGASDYFENTMRYQGVAANGDRNYGGRTDQINGDIYDGSGAWDWRGIQRLDGTVIPAGTITAADWKITASNNATVSGGMYCVRLLSGNALWVQGTNNGTAQTGSSCGNYFAYDATTPTNWAGSAGMWTDATDYTLDRSSWPLPTTTVLNTQYTVSIDPTWMTEARDDDTNEAGWSLQNGSSGVTTQQNFYSTEHGTAGNRPLVTVTYNDPTSGGYYYQSIYGRRRR